MTSRADLIRAVLEAEAIAAAYRDRAKAYRRALQSDALAELEGQGTAPTWRLQDLATASLPLSQPSVVVAEPGPFGRWVARQYPTEAERVIQVRSAFQPILLDRLEPVTGRRRTVDEETGEMRTQSVTRLVDPLTGRPVPGVIQRPGGEAGSLRIVPAKVVKEQLADQAAAEVVATLGPIPESAL